VLIFMFCVVGLFPLLGAVLPVPAIVPILLYIGLVIGAQAFAAVPKAHYAAIVLACVPNIAAWGSSQIDNALAAAGTNADKVGSDALNGAGVIYDGLTTLGSGAVLAGMVLGAIAAFLIDRKFAWAAGYAFFAAGLSSIGLIHGPKIEFFTTPNLKIALGYVFFGIVCLAFHALGVAPREVDASDPIDVADAAPVAVMPMPEPEPAPPPGMLPEPARA
jgi:AGZA family xanthine/uracil permease-like MFS transporter